MSGPLSAGGVLSGENIVITVSRRSVTIFAFVSFVVLLALVMSLNWFYAGGYSRPTRGDLVKVGFPRKDAGFYPAYQDSMFLKLALKSGTDKVTQTAESGTKGHAYDGLYTKVQLFAQVIRSESIC